MEDIFLFFSTLQMEMVSNTFYLFGIIQDNTKELNIADTCCICNGNFQCTFTWITLCVSFLIQQLCYQSLILSFQGSVWVTSVSAVRRLYVNMMHEKSFLKLRLFCVSWLRNSVQ